MDVSVIIPCYNSGAYLREALDSVVSAPVRVSFEIIVVDDGSTDEPTIALLKQLEQEGITIIHQENKGPAAARNTGVRASTGKYLLFLDSDNKIVPAYMEKGVAAFGADKRLGVVYGQPSFFGDTDKPRFTTGPFDAAKLLGENYIDMCAMVRRKLWEDTGGLDESRFLIGHEDWEFWISAMSRKWKFLFIEEILFNYRVLSDSLITSAYDFKTFENKIFYIYSKNIKNRQLKKIALKNRSMGFYLNLFKINKRSFFNVLFNKIIVK